MSKVPPGSAWLVLPVTSARPRGWPRTGDHWGVSALSRPSSDSTWMASIEYTEISPGTIILVGDTFIDEHTGRRDVEFVEVLLPRRWFVNRIHFNKDSDVLKRVI